MTEKKLVSAFIQFLNDQMSTASLSSDSVESLEVAVQCLESAFNVSSSDENLLPSKPLLEIFQNFCDEDEVVKDLPPEASAEDKEEAERLKNEGNTLMRDSKLQEALECYTKAIELDGRNAIFYCNRAAVNSKLGNHHQAILDGHRALKIDPSYSKAYSRIGLAHTHLKQHEEARNAYQKALDMEPENETYRNNLALCENMLATQGFNSNAAPPISSLGNIFGNADLMSLASQAFADPAMQNLIGSIGNIMPEGGGVDALLRAGQQLAQHMQTSNPELVEQIRRSLDPQGRGEEPPPPPPPPSSAP